jgi:hypothetical protein
MLNLSKFLTLSAVCATPLLAMEELQAVERLELPEGHTSLLATCDSTSHHVAPSREELLEKLKYVGPILQSRIDCNNHVLPLLKEIKTLKAEKDLRESNNATAELMPINSRSCRARLFIKQGEKSLLSLQRQIDEKLVKLQEITDLNFDASQLDCFISFKEIEQEINISAQQFYEHIQSSSDNETFLNAISNLYAYLSAASHVHKPIEVTKEESSRYLNEGQIEISGVMIQLKDRAIRATDAQQKDKEDKNMVDHEYHKMILKLLKPYCTEKAKIFHSFFSKHPDFGMNISTTNYKYKKIFYKTLDVEHKIEEQADDMIKMAVTLRTHILLDKITNIDKTTAFFDFSSKIEERFPGKRQSKILLNHVIFKQFYELFSEEFLELALHYNKVGHELAHLLHKYDTDLDTLNCTKKPAFLPICLEILAQPDFDSIIDDDSDEGLTIEEKLSKLLIDVEGPDTKAAEESVKEEVSTQHSQKKVSKKKGKKKKAKSTATTARVNPDTANDSDEEHDSSLEDEAITVADAQEQPKKARSTLKISYLPSNPNMALLADESIPSDRLNKEEKAAQPVAIAKEAKQKRGIKPAKMELYPWIEHLLTAHEYDFKDTIESIYYGLAGMGLKPDFMTRNEKFVLGFMSPRTGQPFAITYDVPHGAQLKKGQAAGWIKNIKHCLREHGVIPTGY